MFPSKKKRPIVTRIEETPLKVNFSVRRRCDSPPDGNLMKPFALSMNEEAPGENGNRGVSW